MRKAFPYMILLISACVFAQQKDKNLPRGNDAFADKKFADAEADYRISSSKSPKKAAAAYNLGNAIYRQKATAEAGYAYKKAISGNATMAEKHEAFHNLGNVFMKQKNYQGAVEAYKNALRNDPSDEQTRYNFALAKKMLKENPPKNDKNKDKKDKKDDKKDNKDKKNQDKKDQQQKDQDKKDQDKKDQDKKNQKDDQKKGDKPEDKQQGQPKPQPGDIPKERLQNLLDAVNNEEKKVQDKVKARQVKAKTVKTEKDW